jgi:hypothetical protein
MSLTLRVTRLAEGIIVSASKQASFDGRLMMALPSPTVRVTPGSLWFGHKGLFARDGA